MPIAILTTIGLLFVLLGTGAWVSLSLMGVGIGSLTLFRSIPVDKLLAQSVWNGLSSPELVALPLFILMAELLYRSRFTNNLFASLEPWVRNLPGGLLHTNVLGCTFFALISGSSAATTSAIGRLTLPELEKRGYNRAMSMGSLAGAGTLGFLIPPSIIMIIYGVLSQTSVIKLFAAGIIPGLVLALMFMGYLALASFFVPRAQAKEEQGREGIWGERLRGIPSLLPFVGLMASVLGSMYAGLASPSEAAALAVGLTCLVMLIERSLSWKVIKESCIGAARTASMLGLIIAAASFLSVAMGFLGLPQAVSAYIKSMELGPIALITLLLLIYVLLGCFLEGMSLMVMTLPIVIPLITGAGYDKIWFGVFLIIVIEMAQITPPVGINLFVIQGLTREKMYRIALSAVPFFLIMVCFVYLITFFPQIVTYLPGLV
ncbi:TRAP dicarboxylate transporter, DctM subunit, unknown substrate 5 [plant metagenome]|uniref:TRAP C4-dicarboxylate transport system permease DctM subunit domain-containing protein n=1 Tax=plant metagenome TaxID=1297885 RepID=A0A484QFE3_9ZZZZ